MADFDTLESSVEDSRPIEVYEFALGAEVFRYTSAMDEITLASDTYEPIAIIRGPIVQGSDSREAVLELTLPADNEFAAKYIDVVPGLPASLSIIRVQRDESLPWTQILIYKGYIRSARFPGNGLEAILAAKSIESTASRKIPRFTYQTLCNNYLYDDQCGVNKTTYEYIGEVTAETTNTITVTGADGEIDGYYNAGYVEPSSASLNDRRMILGHVGNVITVLMPFTASLVGLNVKLYPGCDHKIDGHCNTRYSNVANHSGFAFVPSRNPFRSGLV